MPTSDRTIQEIYTQAICKLSAEEQLRLAALILNNLTQKELSDQNVEYSDTWTEQDRREIAAFSWQNMAMVYSEE